MFRFLFLRRLVLWLRTNGCAAAAVTFGLSVAVSAEVPGPLAACTWRNKSESAALLVQCQPASDGPPARRYILQLRGDSGQTLHNATADQPDFTVLDISVHAVSQVCMNTQAQPLSDCRSRCATRPNFIAAADKRRSIRRFPLC